MADFDARAGEEQRDFLGIGWSFPPTFSRLDASVVMNGGEMDIQESLWILFSTQPGERVMLPKYGSQIWRMVFQAIDTTLMSRLKESIRVAILNWEPRIDVVDIEVSRNATVEGQVDVSVGYRVRTTNSRGNFVYPFYLEEGTLLPGPLG